MTRHRRDLTADDRAVWTTFTQAIRPLRARPLLPAPENEPQPKPYIPRSSARPQIVEPAPMKIAPPPLTGLDRRTKKRVARGHEPIGGRLDLHGLTQDEAHGALLHFLRGAAARDKKLVLVITGKSGVLRRQVPHWLALADMRDVVIGFEPAHVAHGGEGALYVRVRRSRG